MTPWLLLLLAMHPAAPETHLDSVYTRLADSCEALPTVEGGDESWACKGPDELVVRIDFSAADAALNAVMDTQGVEQPIDGILGIDTERGVIEWRLAGELPIALIVRSTPIEWADDGSAHRGKAQTLEIRGVNRLMGFQSSIDVRTTPNANALARQQIDAAWAREQR
ncbi:MAG: hypothetical protein U1F26_10960 [Lysobacterales bacterium]